MFTNHLPALWQTFQEFYRFSPGRISLSLLLMLLQGVTAGVGLLMIIPLLQLVGFELAAGGSQAFSHAVENSLTTLGIPITLPAILAIYVVIVSIVAGLRYMLTVLTVSIQQTYICLLRDRLFRGLLHTRWQFIIQHRMSDFVHSLSGQVQSVGYASQLMLNLLSQTILLSIYVLLSLLLSWQLSLLALGCALLLFLMLMPFNRRVYESGKSELASYKQIFQMLTEQLASMKMIKSYASERYYADQLQKVGHRLEQQHIRISRINALTSLVYAVGAVLAFSILFYFAVQWFEIPLATLLLLLFIFSRLLPQVSGIQSSYQRLTHQLPAFDDVQSLLRDCADAQETRSAIAPPAMQQHIELRDVTFRYPGKNIPVIDSLNLTIRRNESLAVTGSSGAGKSTVADLIAGLLVPDGGDILCDNTPLTDDNRMAWRETIAYVTQEVYLFHDTVRNNLNWVNPDASDDDLWRVLELAAARGFVESLPDGLDTLVGDRGIRLSGGERQRLALARALLSNPQLLILDEATSALDHENERRIQQALTHLHGKLTIIIIAHRKTTIEHVDQSVRLGN